MAQSLAKIVTHIVFSTKHRQKLLLDKYREGTHSQIEDTITKVCCSVPIAIGSVEDHIHLLIGISKNISLSSLVEKIKVSSSRWIKSSQIEVPNFAWQHGYGAFSVSESNIDVVKKYIANQRQHHAKLTFEDELISLLTKHRIAFDRRYLFS
jgi:putative transposase